MAGMGEREREPFYAIAPFPSSNCDVGSPPPYLSLSLPMSAGKVAQKATSNRAHSQKVLQLLPQVLFAETGKTSWASFQVECVGPKRPPKS